LQPGAAIPCISGQSLPGGSALKCSTSLTGETFIAEGNPGKLLQEESEMVHRTTPLLPRVPVARLTDCCVTANASHLSAEPRLCGRGGPYSLSDERTNFLRRPSEVLLRTGSKNLQLVLAVRVIANNTPGANGIDLCRQMRALGESIGIVMRWH